MSEIALDRWIADNRAALIEAAAEMLSQKADLKLAAFASVEAFFDALYAAAWVLNHGELSEEAALGSRLAARAAELGHAGARWLAAAALDRSLMYAGLPQKYGTNIVPDGVGWRLWDVDPATTDAERLANDVPPLVEMQARAAANASPRPDPAGAPDWLSSAMRRRGTLPPE